MLYSSNLFIYNRIKWIKTSRKTKTTWNIFHQFKNWKASGENRIIKELLKIGETVLKKAVKLRLNEYLKKGRVPKALKNAKRIKLKKIKKGNSTNTNIARYWPISLLSDFFEFPCRTIISWPFKIMPQFHKLHWFRTSFVELYH